MAEAAEMAASQSDDGLVIYDITIPIVGVITLSLIAIAAVGTCRLYAHRREVYVQKRYHKTLRNGGRYPLCYNIDAIFGLNTAIILGMIMSAATLLVPYYFEDDGNDQIHLTLECASYGPWFLIMLFLNVKNWTLYFKFKRQHFMVQSEWQKIINPDETQKRLDHNWYIRNNKTWGNLSTVYIYFGILHLLAFCILITIDVIGKWRFIERSEVGTVAILNVVEIILAVLPFILYIVIEAKTPHFNDLFFIHWESRMEAKLTAILIAILLTSDLMLTINESLSLFSILILTSLRSLVLFGNSFVSTFMVIRKNTPHRSNSDESRWANLKPVNSRTPKALDHVAKSESASPSGSQSSIKFKGMFMLDQILMNPEALNLFMLHLSKEYSMELLLSYIEIDQFQKHVIRTADKFLKEFAVGNKDDNDLDTPISVTSVISPEGHFDFRESVVLLDHFAKIRDQRSSSLNLMAAGRTPPKLAAIAESEPPKRDQSESPPFPLVGVNGAKGKNEKVENQPKFQIRLSDLNHMPDIEVMDTIRNVPPSQILQQTATTRTDHMEFDERTMRDIKKRAHLLWRKYIREGAEFEINISWHSRQTLTKKLGDKQKLLDNEEMRLSHLVELYQEPKMDMKQLLHFSLSRLRNAPEADELHALLTLNKDASS